MDSMLMLAAHFMNGQAVFTGMLLVLITVTLRFGVKKPRLRSVLNMLIILGVIFVLASATPWSYWWYGGCFYL